MAYVIGEINYADYTFGTLFPDRPQSRDLHRVFHKAKYMLYAGSRPRLSSVPFLLRFRKRMVSVAFFMDHAFYISLCQSGC